MFNCCWVTYVEMIVADFKNRNEFFQTAAFYNIRSSGCDLGMAIYLFSAKIAMLFCLTRKIWFSSDLWERLR